MTFVLLGLLCAFIGAFPLLARKKISAFLWQFAITGILGIWMLWGETPSTVYPLFGFYGILVLFFLVVAAIIDGNTDEYGDGVSWTIWPPILLFAAFIVILISGSGMFRASDYANMLKVEENRVWTKDVQPKDPAHMRMSTKENALYQAQKSLGSAGTIGSQFAIAQENVTLQLINGELWYVAPLDYKGFSVWTSSKGIPAYIKISAEDPTAQPIIVSLKDGKEMVYSPGAYWSSNLERHMRTNGYLNVGLSDWTFEVDESGNPWWVVTVYKPTIAWSGDKVLGVALVNPTNGDIAFVEMGKIPDWVDRAVPSRIVTDYLTWNGEYSGGWWNSFWANLNMTRPESPTLVYGADNQPQFVTGITSASSSDDSLVALVYTNSRTGNAVKYTIKGGATETAVINAVNSNQEVQYKHLHAAAPQLYNVNGVPTSVVPLFNDVNAYQGVAMVDIANIQEIAVGSDQHEALRVYEKILNGDGSRAVAGNETKKQVVEGIVTRTGSEVTPTSGSIYYFQVENIPQLFTAGPGKYPSLVVTQKGDKVRVEVYKNDRDVVPILTFENLSLKLSKSAKQQQVDKASGSVHKGITAETDANAIKDRINHLTPEQIQELGKQVPPAN
ncbi:MAG: hypothetical protein WC878_07440 [Candidatus Paceibacterota bacterium]|jgi:hypothetical protein